MRRYANPRVIDALQQTAHALMGRASGGRCAGTTRVSQYIRNAAFAVEMVRETADAEGEQLHALFLALCALGGAQERIEHAQQHGLSCGAAGAIKLLHADAVAALAETRKALGIGIRVEAPAAEAGRERGRAA